MNKVIGERYDRDLCDYVRRCGKFRNIYIENDDAFFIFAWYWLIVRRGSMGTLAQFVYVNRAIERAGDKLYQWICESEDLKVLTAYYEETVKYTRGSRV